MSAPTSGGDRRITKKTSAIEDTYAVQANPTKTSGSEREVFLDGTTDALRWGFVKFNLRLPANYVVTSAEVKLLMTEDNDDGVHVRTIRGVTEDNEWNEATLNWNNKPAMGDELDETGATDPLVSYKLDVTEDLKATGSGIYSFGFRTGGGNVTKFASRDHPDRPAAKLIVQSVYRAYRSDSFWNKGVKAAPLSTNSAGIINYLMKKQGPDFAKLHGAPRAGSDYDEENDSEYGLPVYFSQAADQLYTIRRLDDPNLHSDACDGLGSRKTFDYPTLQVRIPAGAHPDGYSPNYPDSTNDAQLLVIDKSWDDPDRAGIEGLAAALHAACYYNGQWYAGGTDTFELASNGMAKYWNTHENGGVIPATVYGTAPVTNRGHRGITSMTDVIRWAEYRAGAIHHALQIAIWGTRPVDFFFPMEGTEDGAFGSCSGVPAPCTVPAEGTRIRLKAGTSLSMCSPGAKIVYEAFKKYGAYITDQTGDSDNPDSAHVGLRVENLVAEGRTNLWRFGPDAAPGGGDDNVLVPDSLSCAGTVTFNDFEVIQEGYMP
ncbi:MAG: DNRLRE domain-containing protein [Actinomycetota bacterium]|nr:DNRLRE domain-containing protein [Actinomycetota bacterium]